MILEIDVGNTWSKWRLLNGREIIERGKTLSVDFPQDELRALKKVSRIRLASVSPRADTLVAAQSLMSSFGVSVEIAETKKCEAGVINSYQDPAHMGVDRWLGMLAAFNRPLTMTAKRGCLVVSCGTAVTIDGLSDDGLHEGGYILPGLIMMRSALLSKTGRIRFATEDFDISRKQGNSTATAVEHGAVHAVASAIERACDDRVKRLGACDLLMTGGDAQSLSRCLVLDASMVSCHYVEDLVLNGLQYALP